MWSYLSDYAQQYYTELLVHVDALWMNFKNVSSTWEGFKPSEKILKNMQKPSAESSWTDVTIPNNTSSFPGRYCQSKNKIKVQGSDNVQNEKVWSGSINLLHWYEQ